VNGGPVVLDEGAGGDANLYPPLTHATDADIYRLAFAEN